MIIFILFDKIDELVERINRFFRLKSRYKHVRLGFYT